ncbi:MAG: tRNA uridine-5-carboxymethylaminomethyl(34) synthesis GTPase MnmE [Chlamydiia bacterium]|nr:tRNA uridine-5-carboxymethylaminomethyl(34) synthesis GTPase MnmE [Chlamydiia bacterium]
MISMKKWYDTKDTIAAIATPPGEGGVAIIRISGDQALDVANRIFSKNVFELESHRAIYGKIVHQSEIIDHVLLLPMHAPKSYTGETVVEINCHGGRMAQKVLDCVFAAGARPAEPGEFTYRAFLNGKIDLAQAEAVQSMIGAKNDMALEASKQQLEGALSKKVQNFQKRLADAAAILEAWVDFPEEGLEFASTDEMLDLLSTVRDDMQRLHATFRDGQIIKEGISCCLIGAPNVGKSSLMNLLLGKERAIVTNQPGTTRDVLEDQLQLGPLQLRLIDTAGIRMTDEAIEQEGVRRSHKTLESSDVIFLVCDSTRALNQEEIDLIKNVNPEKTVLIWNKTDLTPIKQERTPLTHQVKMSAKTGIGLDELKAKVLDLIWINGMPDKDQIVLTNKRHFTALGSAIENICTLMKGLKSQISCEFLASDMRACLLNLSHICGTDVTEDILSSIFSKFCVGK